jgi:6-phosphogluconolactonase/glucosamine-6-phosphate isomerase/deaminase
MIAPNPWPSYDKVARLINEHRISCHHLHTFNMDEYANEHGDIAPESWAFGFGHAFKKFFYANIDADLRPPENQIHGLSNENIAHYGKMLADLGGADICYSGPGWTGHLAFIEPDAPEFAAASLEEWKKMGPRVCTLSPFTIAQNSLHGCFGASGDLTAVPPKAATIGPAEVVGAKHRIDQHGITVGGGFHSWQRLTSRTERFATRARGAARLPMGTRRLNGRVASAPWMARSTCKAPVDTAKFRPLIFSWTCTRPPSSRMKSLWGPMCPWQARPTGLLSTNWHGAMAITR